MRLRSMIASFAAVAMAVTPVAASANPAAALSLAAAQESEAAGTGGGMSTGTIVGILFALTAVVVGVAVSGEDDPSSP